MDEALSRIGHCARGVVTDVGDEAQVQRLLDSVPRVDLLVTCAGGAVFGPVETVPMSAWQALFNDRFFGQLSAVRYAVPKMPEGGAIVLCSGIAGAMPRSPTTRAARACAAPSTPWAARSPSS